MYICHRMKQKSTAVPGLEPGTLGLPFRCSTDWAIRPPLSQCSLFNSFGAKFQTTFVVCFFFILTNLRLERRLYVKLKQPSHLHLCCLQKSIIIACDSERINWGRSKNWKGICSKRKENNHFRRKFFPVWVNALSEGTWCTGNTHEVTKIVFLVKLF